MNSKTDSDLSTTVASVDIVEYNNEDTYTHVIPLKSLVFTCRIQNENPRNPKTTSMLTPVHVNYIIHRKKYGNAYDICRDFSFGGIMDTPPVYGNMAYDPFVAKQHRNVSLDYKGEFICLDFFGSLASLGKHCFLVLKYYPVPNMDDKVYNFGNHGSRSISHDDGFFNFEAYCSTERYPEDEDLYYIDSLGLRRKCFMLYVGVYKERTKTIGNVTTAKSNYKFAKLKDLDAIMNRPVIHVLIP